jgi:hypothetical protein
VRVEHRAPGAHVGAHLGEALPLWRCGLLPPRFPAGQLLDRGDRVRLVVGEGGELRGEAQRRQIVI